MLVPPSAKSEVRSLPRIATPAALVRVRNQTGIGRDLIKRIEARYPGNPKKQLKEFFAKFEMPAATGRRRTVSFRTVNAMVAVVSKTIDDLAEPSVNMRLENLSNLSGKNVRAVTELWIERGMSPSYLASQNTALRRITTWFGKPDAVPRLSDMLGPGAADAYKRSYTAVQTKSWEEKGVDIEAVFEAMDEKCPVTGLQLRLVLVNGLRVREAMMFRPHVADRGTELYVSDGTKGGRARFVPITSEHQREIVDKCKLLAAGNRRGIVSPRPEGKLAANIKHFYYLCAKIGITKKDLGITAHGLRHTYVNRRYEQLTGQKAPVDGGGMVERKVERAAKQIIAEAVGHSRPQIVGCYTGHPVTLNRLQAAAQRKLCVTLGSDAELLRISRAADFAAVYVLGLAAEGRPYNRNILVAFEAKAQPGQTTETAEAALLPFAAALSRRIELLLRSKCQCMGWSLVADKLCERLEISQLTGQLPTGGPATSDHSPGQ